MKTDVKNGQLFTEGVDYPAQKESWNEAVCDDEITLAARKAFGITYLYPWQRIVIAGILDSAMAGEDGVSTGSNSTMTGSTGAEEGSTDTMGERNGKQIVLLPTGAGKSLCFLTPALILPGPTLVLYPLLALMADQKRRMDSGGLTSVIFKGGQTEQEREDNFRALEKGAKIILANPEVLQNEKLVERLAECNISHIAIDEAHCTSEWGDSFRPAYLTLGKIIKRLKVPTVTAFTATASPQVLARVSEVLFDGQAAIVRSDSDRPNIHYFVTNAYAKKRTAFKLAVRSEKPLIIFCGTRKHAQDMARDLAEYYGSEKVKFYHAGMEKEEKTAIEKWFFPRTDAILCATCAFGMGVDKSDIRNVIHLDCPSTIESYIQEAGRGGRNGSVANGILIWSPEDFKKFSALPQTSRQYQMKRFATSRTCRRQVLMEALEGESYLERNERTWCDGCDICLNKRPAPFAEDADTVLEFIKKHPRRYGEDELCTELLNIFNEKDLKEFKRNIWESGDITEILKQLEDQDRIRKCRWPWKEKYELVRPRHRIQTHRRKPLLVWAQILERTVKQPDSF